jgi:ABC-type oligopeptide transport system substrate-binding subunit
MDARLTRLRVEFDALLNKIKNTTDLDERRNLLEELRRVLNESLAIVEESQKNLRLP